MVRPLRIFYPGAFYLITSWKEISLHFGISGSAVFPSRRRAAVRMEKDRNMLKQIENTEIRLNLSRIKT